MELIQAVPQKNSFGDWALTPDGKTILTDDGIWDARTGLQQRKLRGLVCSPIVCAPDGKFVAGTTYSNQITSQQVVLVNIATGKRELKFDFWDADDLAFSADGELIATVNSEEKDDGEYWYVTTIFDRMSKKVKKYNHADSRTLFGVKIQGARLVAFSESNGNLELRNAETNELLLTLPDIPFEPLDSRVMGIAIATNGQWLGIGMANGDLHLIDLSSSSILWQTRAHEGWLRTIAFSGDGETMATAGDDFVIHVWETKTGKSLGTLGFPRPSVEAVAFTPDGRLLTTLDSEEAARCWSFDPPSMLQITSGIADLIRNVGRKYPAGVARHFQDLILPEVALHTEPLSSTQVLAISPDGTRSALLGHEGDLIVWNNRSCTVEILLKDACYHVNNEIAFSPDNRWLATGVAEHLRVFNLSTGTERHETTIEQYDWIVTLVFSPDSNTLAIGYLGFKLILLDLLTWKKRSIRPEFDCVSTLSFAPDSKTLAIGTSYDETAWLKSLSRGGKETPLIGHTGFLRSADFSPDGSRVVTGATDGTARIWDVTDGKLLATFLALASSRLQTNALLNQ